MHAETNLCIMRERQTKWWAESWVPINSGARVLGGWGGRQLPWARLLEGRLYLFLFRTIRIQVVVPGHNHLA